MGAAATESVVDCRDGSVVRRVARARGAILWARAARPPSSGGFDFGYLCRAPADVAWLLASACGQTPWLVVAAAGRRDGATARDALVGARVLHDALDRPLRVRVDVVARRMGRANDGRRPTLNHRIESSPMGAELVRASPKNDGSSWSPCRRRRR